MDRSATKTRFERQTEEDERLVRPSPADKPPRRDLRRERTKPEKDPDLDDASDRKDRSKNYKVTAADERIPAKNRETGETVHISPNTLKEQPGKYEALDPDEAAKAKKPKGEEPEGEKEEKPPSSKPEKLDKAQFYGKAGDALRALAKDDPKLESKLNDFSNPQSQLSGMAKENADFPAASLFPGVKLPDGLRTLGDIKQALEFSTKKPAGKGKKKKPAPAGGEEAPPSSEPPKSEPSGEAPAEQPPAEAPQAPAEQPAEAPAEKPKKKKKDKGEAPKDEEAPAEKKVREPSEAEKAGIGEPKRRATTSADREEALSLLVHTFDPHMAAEIIAKNLHPDDVKTLVRDYNSAKLGVKVKDPASLAATASSFYQPDPSKVPPPKVGRNAAGERVPLDQLSPDEQAESLRQHQLRVAAMSMAARDVLTDKLTDRGHLTGRPQIPPSLAAQAASMMLQPPNPKYADVLATQTFDTTLKNGLATKINDRAAQRLLSHLKGSPAALASAKAYMQANDYGLAKERFLKGDDDSFSEWQHPKDIVRGLKKAGQFFDQRNDLYGGEPEHPAAQMFRMRVLGRLRTLDPKKADEVTKALPALEDEEYQRHVQHWEKLTKDWEARKAKHKGEGEFAEPPPHKPKPPAGRPDPKEGEAMWEEVAGQKPPKTKEASDFTYLSPLVMGTPAVKTAVYHGVDPYAYGPAAYPGWLQPHQRDFGESDFDSIVSSANDWLSSSLLTLATDGLVADARYRAALDLAIYAGPYNGQIQPNVYNRLLAKLAQMPEPGMGETLETIREKKARSSYETARLDLLVRGELTAAAKEAVNKANFPYKDDEGTVRAGGSVAVRSVKASGPGTLVTVDLPKGSEKAAFVAIQAALEPLKLTVTKSPKVSTDTSTFTPTTSDPTGGSTSMKASQELYRIAGSLAETNSKASFDLLALADRLAEDEKKMPPWLEKKIDDKEDEKKEASSGKYASLRSTIIKQASSTPAEQRGPLLPILQALKDLG